MAHLSDSLFAVFKGGLGLVEILLQKRRKSFLNAMQKISSLNSFPYWKIVKQPKRFHLLWRQWLCLLKVKIVLSFRDSQS